MRIAIDYTAAVRQGAGVGRYTRGLVSALAQLDQQNHYTLLISGTKEPYPASLPAFGHTTYRRIPFSDRLLAILWHRLRLPLYADVWAGGADVFHCPEFTLPPLYRARGIVTVHDLTFMHYPECTTPNLARYLNSVVPRSVGRASLVLADSESTRRDLVTMLHVPEVKLRVVYAGVGPHFQPVRDTAVLAEVRTRYRLDLPFVLTLGTLEPRKNYVRLLHAFRALRSDRFADFRLVIVGGKGWLYQEIFEAVERLRLTDRVVFPGFVADADLPALYSLAAAFVYPSLYEGFGIPVLEALACGTPTVCSQASSLPEVAGDAALMVDPLSVEALAEAMEQVLTDEPLRRDLAERGRQRAARFTWTAAAQELVRAYQDAAK